MFYIPKSIIQCFLLVFLKKYTISKQLDLHQFQNNSWGQFFYHFDFFWICLLYQLPFQRTLPAFVISSLCLLNLNCHPVLLHPWSVRPLTSPISNCCPHIWPSLSELESLTLEDISSPCISFGNNIFQKALQNSEACRCHEELQLAEIPSSS